MLVRRDHGGPVGVRAWDIHRSGWIVAISHREVPLGTNKARGRSDNGPIHLEPLLHVYHMPGATWRANEGGFYRTKSCSSRYSGLRTELEIAPAANSVFLGVL